MPSDEIRLHSNHSQLYIKEKNLNEVTEITRIAIPRVDVVFDTLGGDAVFDLFSGFTQLTIDADAIPLTAFCTLNRLYEWLHMPQGAAGALPWFVSIMLLATATLDNIRMYIEGAIGSNGSLPSIP